MQYTVHYTCLQCFQSDGNWSELVFVTEVEELGTTYKSFLHVQVQIVSQPPGFSNVATQNLNILNILKKIFSEWEKSDVCRGAIDGDEFAFCCLGTNVVGVAIQPQSVQFSNHLIS